MYYQKDKQKYNQKSVRLSDEVYNYINDFRGDNFNQKLENVVMFARGNEILLKSRIDSLNDLIVKKQDELSQLSHEIHDLRVIDNKLSDIVRFIDVYISDYNKTCEVNDYE